MLKISQSKREYLDNYPDFQLQWLEGHEIVDIVLNNKTLRKIWIENEEIYLSSNSISVPFVLRKLPEDIAIEPELSFSIRLPNDIEVEVRERRFFLQNQFRPFHNLDIRKSGNTFGNVFAYVAVMSGKINFNSINEVKEQILEEFRENDIFSYDDSYLAIRFGIPHFTETDEPVKKYRTEKFNLPINSETFIIQSYKIINEYRFLIEISNGWKKPDRIHMSQLSDFCFYNRDYNFVFYLYYNCVAKEELHPHVTRNIEIEKIIWQKSLFISGQNELINQFIENFKNFYSDKLYSYGPNGKIACWMHPRPFMYSANFNEFEKAFVHKEFEKRKEQIFNKAIKDKLDIINWEIASKVAAINNEDPFPSNPETLYRIVDILEDFHNIPSPIKPDNREFIFECVWAISNKEDITFKKRLNKFSNDVNNLDKQYELSFMIDNETSGIVFIRVTCIQNYISYLSTNENIEKLTKPVQ